MQRMPYAGKWLKLSTIIKYLQENDFFRKELSFGKGK